MKVAVPVCFSRCKQTLPIARMNVLAAAAELIESDAVFALRIQTSEPVLVRIARAHGRGAMSAAGMQLLRDRHDRSPTEASAVVLAPYMFGMIPRSQRSGDDRSCSSSSNEEPVDPWMGKRGSERVLLAVE